MNKVEPLQNNIPKTKGWITLTECPRDAMQSWQNPIDTKSKIEYLNALIATEIAILDCGSFVSAKAIPQLADTAEVLNNINTTSLKSKLLVIVANERGAVEAATFKQITYIGFPFSISPTFQLKNTNKTLDESLDLVKKLVTICKEAHKTLVVYISMAFGNPYGDEYNNALLNNWIIKIMDAGVTDIRLADTVGLATAEEVFIITKHVLSIAPKNINIGLHLHGTAENSKAKIEAGLKAGCLRFDTAIGGFGGCPLSGTALVGNIDTQLFLNTVKENGYYCPINNAHLETAAQKAKTIFV